MAEQKEVLKSSLNKVSGTLSSVLGNLRGLLKFRRPDAIRKIILSLLKRRVLLVITLTGLVAGLVFLFLARGHLGGGAVETEVVLGRATVGNLEIFLDPGTFATRKTLRIRAVRGREAASLRQIGSFDGEFYELIPSDGNYDMPSNPLRVRYYIPNYSEGLYWTFASIDPDAQTYNLLPGGFIRRDRNRGFYIESYLFVLPRWLGVTTVAGKTVRSGFEKVRELVTDEPALLVVPGSDLNFAGIVELGKISSAPLWERIFPKRSIFVYRYPLAEVRPRNYVEQYESFTTSGFRNEITYHAEQVANFLRSSMVEKPELQFDILAHEIGGLIVYYCLAKHRDITNVRRVAYLSVPFLGTNLANTALVSKIYGTEVEFAEPIYRTSATTFSNLRIYLKSYLETVGAYYSDLAPRSEFTREVEMLKDPQMSSRLGRSVAVYMGSSGPLSIDVSGSALEDLFPELTANRGDGLVTVDSASFPFTSPDVPPAEVVKTFPGAWNSFYTSKEFVDELVQFFKYEPPELPDFTNDQFAERAGDSIQKSLERFVGLEEGVRFKVSEWKLSDNPKLSFVGRLEIPGTQIAVLGNVVYTADETGLYVGGSKIWEGPIRNLKTSEDGVSYGTMDRVIFRKLTETVEYEVQRADDYLALRRFAVFAVPKANNWYEFTDERGNLLARLWGTYSKVLYDGDEIIFLTNRELYRLQYGIKYRAPLPKVRTKPSGEEEIVDPRSYDMTYAIGVEDLIVATTRAYGLLVFDKSGNFFYTGEGWVGNLGLYQVGKYVIAVGSNFVTVVDVEKREIDRIVQNIRAMVYDAAISGDKLYLMTNEGVLIYQII